MSIKGQGHSLTSSKVTRFSKLNPFFSETVELFDAKYYMKDFGSTEMKICTNRLGRPKTSSSPPVISLLAVLRRVLCFGSLVVLDVVFRYLSLFLLYINIKIGKNRC